MIQNFNFNEFVNNLDVKEFLDDNSTLPCEYAVLHLWRKIMTTL